jgi:hypothetical protein
VLHYLCFCFFVFLFFCFCFHSIFESCFEFCVLVFQLARTSQIGVSQQMRMLISLVAKQALEDESARSQIELEQQMQNQRNFFEQQMRLKQREFTEVRQKLLQQVSTLKMQLATVNLRQAEAQPVVASSISNSPNTGLPPRGAFPHREIQARRSPATTPSNRGASGPLADSRASPISLLAVANLSSRPASPGLGNDDGISAREGLSRETELNCAFAFPFSFFVLALNLI